MFSKILFSIGALLFVAVIGQQMILQSNCSRAEARSVQRALSLVASINHAKIKRPSATYEELLSNAPRPLGAVLDKNAEFHLLPEALRMGDLVDVEFLISIGPEPGGLCYPICVYSNGRVEHTSWDLINHR